MNYPPGGSVSAARQALRSLRWLWILLAVLGPAALWAQPTYAEVSRRLPEIWKEHFPVEGASFEALTSRGILRMTDGGRLVYYYRYQAQVPRMTRKESEGIVPGPRRKLELWVRFVPGQKSPYSLHFLREDLLPGSGRTWIRR